MSFSEDIFKEYETFKNKNAIITGATGTIGTEVTKKLLIKKIFILNFSLKKAQIMIKPESIINSHNFPSHKSRIFAS